MRLSWTTSFIQCSTPITAYIQRIAYDSLKYTPLYSKTQKQKKMQTTDRPLVDAGRPLQTLLARCLRRYGAVHKYVSAVNFSAMRCTV